MNTYQIIEQDFLNKVTQLAEQYKNEVSINDSVRELYCEKVGQLYKRLNSGENGLNFGLAKKVFLFDEQMNKSLTLLENKILANEIKEFLKDYSANSQEVINIKVSLAHTMIEDNKTCQWDDEVYSIWKNTMKDVPGFNEALIKEKSYWDNWREKNFKIEVNNNTESQEAETAMTLLVYMPIVLKKEQSNGVQKNLQDFSEFPDVYFKSIIDDFNGFKLHKYISDFPIKDIVLGIESENWVFRVRSQEVLNDNQKELFLDLFKSQISEGWGESMGGKRVKTEDSCFFVSFDHENAQISEEIKKKNKIK